MGNFYTEIIVKDPRFRSNRPVADLALLEPVTQAAVAAILTEAAGELMLFETYRSRERQAQLYAQGATQLGTVGVHHYGLACDIVKSVKGRPSWDGDFSFLGVLAQKYGLIWGGDWGEPDKPHSFRDYVHVQRIRVADQGKLFRGEWYPGPDYDPIGGRDARPTLIRLARPYMRGEKVFEIQCRLNHFGWLENDQTDWVYGPVTAAAVRKFQAGRGLPVTGEVDAATAAKLGVKL